MIYRLLLLSSLLLSASCTVNENGQLVISQTANSPVDESNSYTNFYSQAFPPELAVLPVIDKTLASLAPKGDIRETVRGYLLDRNYSVLSNEYLNRNYKAVSASSFSMPQTGAVELVVHFWDERKSRAGGTLAYDVEATIYGEKGAVLANLRSARQTQLSSGELSANGPQVRYFKLLRHVATSLLSEVPTPPTL
ncbi:MAG TPA: hypothetical protein QGG59_05645 [Planctomycetota bacterium]|jgi:hypothetical protein|nr:hypothetical protein [Planctomycetota bacterium]MDP6129031.1 hypothetical protein [Planctomycetota bacterium]MDP7245803.1 hypothetical protein [Planctomycetota bacterium]HJM39580.1 hypothetical protein [Planctomycetota bacterium]|tara:strand:+ start:11019 stop:11600 length:582 start_codon:yes stop_codon:yes gene_type:complete